MKRSAKTHKRISKPRRKLRKTRRQREEQQQGGQQQTTLRVEFPSGIKASSENPLAPRAQVQDAPTVRWNIASTKLKTFVCYDPDAPAGAWLHWLVTNCRGSDPSTGQTVVPWAPPTPPKGTGAHRYLFSVAEQASSIAPVAPQRPGFDPEAFFQDHHMKRITSTGIRVNPDA